jgi:hypothetical protein
VAQFGSRTNSVSQNLSAVQDPQGNLIVSPDNSFGASPLGIAARTQALYGIPNANFNLLPPESTAEIATGNELPYWQIVNLGAITATMTFDETAQAWGVLIDPSSAGSGDSLSLTTRSYLLNDSNLSLRQKAFASITKVGTMATSQWNLVMNATYYDSAGSALSTYAIGTANSGTTWTSINGFTTTGTAVIDAAAQYLDLDLTLTTTTAVTGTAKVDLNSVLLQTSTGGGGGAQSFLITEEFTTSGTFTWPTGVDYLVAAVGIGAGAGGEGGASRWQIGLGTTTNSGNIKVDGNAQGNSGPWVIARDIPRGTSTSLVIGIGAGGAGGAGGTLSKAAGTYIADGTALGGAGGIGGLTTIGNYYTLGSATNSTVIAGTTFGDSRLTGASGAGASLFGTVVPYYPYTPTTFGTGQSGGSSVTNTFAGTTTGYTAFPSTALAGTGVAGSTGAGGASAFGSAGKTGTVQTSSVGTTTQMAANNSGGGAGRSLAQYVNGTARTTGNTITMTASNGGSAAYYGAGGGAGGVVCLSVGGTAYGKASDWTLTGGNGGNGQPGYVVLVYVA